MARPTNIDFYGATKSEKLSSRSHNGFRLSFSEVPGAVEHEFEAVGTDLGGPISNGAVVQLPRTNTVYSIRIRAKLTSGGFSDWSEEFVSMTRPPSCELSRVPYDLQGWGVVLAWTRPHLEYDYDIELRRDNAAGPWIQTFGPTSEMQFVDTSYLLNQSNVYTAAVSVFPAPVPLPYGDDRNASFASTPIEVTGPVSHVSNAAYEVLQTNVDLNDTTLKRFVHGVWNA